MDRAHVLARIVAFQQTLDRPHPTLVSTTLKSQTDADEHVGEPARREPSETVHDRHQRDRNVRRRLRMRVLLIFFF